ncbi:MAG: hypothetical protein M0Q91_12155 [Methanoregula sp.]|jgi:hypothetical protein|nr:hypothetical protein [Methanoregula sp.]
MSEWINIKEKYPQQGKIVLLLSSGIFNRVNLGYWECGRGFVNCVTNYHVYDVTHYCEIPEFRMIYEEKK